MSSLKDQSIIELLAILPLSHRGWVVVDNWEADLCAIGVARLGNPRRLVYISTFRKPAGLYDYECENPIETKPEDYEAVKQGRDIDFKTLVDVIEKHVGRLAVSEK